MDGRRTSPGPTVRFVAFAACIMLPLFVASQESAGVPAGDTVEPVALIPIESFARLPEMSDPELSPDGKVVAAQRRSGGKQFLLIHQLFGKPEGGPSTRSVDLGKSSLNWLRWANDQYLVASVRLLFEYRGNEVPIDRLMVVNRDGRHAPTVLGLVRASLNGDDVIYWAPDGSYVLISEGRSAFEWPEVIRADIPSNKITRIQPSKRGVYRWFANDRGEVVAGVRIGDSGPNVVYRENPDKMFKTILRIKTDRDDDEPDFHIASIDAGTQSAVVVSRRDGDHWGLYEYDFKTSAFGATLFENDKFDIDDYGFDRDGHLRWASYIDDRQHVKWFQQDDLQFYNDLEKALPDKNLLVVSSSLDKSVRIVSASSPTDPGTFYAYTSASGKMAYLASVNLALQAQRLAPMEPVAYKARDGLEIPAYLTMPAGRRAGRLPLIVMPHGGPFSRDSWDYEFLVQYLANRGYVVLQPNFRGSTGYGKAFRERGHSEFGKAMQDDVDDGVKWLADSGVVDPARVCVVGWSYGGYVAQVASFRNPDIYRCGVSIAGISDLESMLRYDYGFMFGDNFRRWRKIVGGEWSKRDLKAISALTRVDSIEIPLLIVHGMDDNVVPVSQSDKLVKSLTKAGKPFDYVRIEDGDHSLWDNGQRLVLLKALEKFLAANNPTDVLGAAPAPSPATAD